MVRFVSARLIYMNVLSQPKAGYTDVLTAEAGHPEGVISAHAG